jgi:hypothetical protein
MLFWLPVKKTYSFQFSSKSEYCVKISHICIYYYTCILYNVFFFFFFFKFLFFVVLGFQVAYSPQDFATSLATYAGCEYKQKIMFSNVFVTRIVSASVNSLVSMSVHKQ